MTKDEAIAQWHRKGQWGVVWQWAPNEWSLTSDLDSWRLEDQKRIMTRFWGERKAKGQEAYLIDPNGKVFL